MSERFVIKEKKSRADNPEIAHCSAYMVHYSHSLGTSECCPLLAFVRDNVLDERQSLPIHLSYGLTC